MRLNITTVRNCDLLLVILVTVSPSKLENELKKHVRNVARITHGFVKVVVIFFFLLLIQDGIMWFLLILLIQPHQLK